MEAELLDYEILDWYLTAGVDEVISDEEVNYYELVPENFKLEKPAKQNVSAPSNQNLPNVANVQKTPVARSKVVPSQVTVSQEELAKSAFDAVKDVQSLEELQKIVEAFEGCPLKETAKNTVFGGGNPSSKLLIIAEAPGADEDRQGVPFVGKSGQLLDKILLSIGVSRDDCYISNVIPWRPPGNRKPTLSEIAICLPFIKKIIELIAPDVIVLLGGSAFSALFDSNLSISKSRGKWNEYDLNGKKIDAMATFHPSYLLRSPAQKEKVWSDFLKISEKLANN